MLNNLRAIYEVRGDQRRLRFVLERMSVLSPSEEVKSRLNALVADVTIAPPGKRELIPPRQIWSD